MNDPRFEPGFPATDPVSAGPVAAGNASAGTSASVGPGATGLALSHPAAAQARWARVGLLGIGAAAMIAAAILAFGATAQPSGTLAAGANGSSSDARTGGVRDLKNGPNGRGGFGLGHGGVTITAISGSSISLTTDDGWTRTITVDSGTTYTKAGATITLGDLRVGDMIGFRQTQASDGTFTIDSIQVVLPRLGGQVTGVNGSTITLKQRDGATATVNVASGAKVMVDGKAATAADIKVGMFLGAEGTRNADGSLDATMVLAGNPRSFRGNGHGFRGGPGAPGGNDNDADDGTPNAPASPTATGSAG